ncbi:MAG: putative repeat protein (TIGR01451 family)/MYXO-CTERM domain-containing protein [Polyangiales bacterium]|jgi:uncharacterized repeat protein (TIGR01451 family)/MYXO-CTERM domain-containing protein
MNRSKLSLSILLSSLTALTFAGLAHADSVAQIATAVRISRGTARLIDPQGRPGMVGMGTDTAVRPGDILTFTAAFTPVPNGGVRGLGGYVTVYIPRNTEVVGARIVDSSGRTVAPHRGGLAADGTGPRGNTTLSMRTQADPEMSENRLGGSMSQLYADTGIFYSVDARTQRVPNGAGPTEVFIRLDNGLLMNPRPTAFGQLDGRLGAPDSFAHNQWDVIQSYGFGSGGSALGTDGRGNTPDFYGSPVAGPESFYTFEATLDGMLLIQDNVIGSDTIGPWMRIRSFGAEIGARGVVPPVPDPGIPTRVGVPAVDGAGRPLGLRIDSANGLPSFDAAAPGNPHTRALRFAVGELVVGEQYLSEFSLRVLDTPLDPESGTDVVCAEVFGGDASAEMGGDGKDNAWRYFLPAPACVSLNLLFDLDVDKLVALSGETLTYTITVKNLSTEPQTAVDVKHCYDGSVAFQTAVPAATSMGSGDECGDNDYVAWTIARLEPGEERVYVLEFEARNGETTGRAVYTSAELPTPGFQTVAYTNIGELAILNFAIDADPAFVPAPAETVHYTARVSNSGTGDADLDCGGCGAILSVPSPFVYEPGSAQIAGVAVADPVVAGDVLTFTDGVNSIAAGDTLIIEFDLTVPMGTAEGVYTTDIETWASEPGGEDINDARATLAEVLVGIGRSETPMVDGPLSNGESMVCGSSSEPAGAVVIVYSGGVEVARGTVGAGGMWCVGVAPLYAGQAISATATAASDLESLPSAEVVVTSVAGGAACSDGIDNDGDGFTDFPDDPECMSADDPDEASVPECADGIDNDGDGDIDFGADPGCSSLIDDTELGPPDCNNGVDDDGDGLTDLDDPGCTDGDDVSERSRPACADGIDNDGDGAIDYPLDDGCASAVDDDETRASDGPDAGMVGADAGIGGDGGIGGSDAMIPADAGFEIPAHGGVEDPSSGCGCAVQKGGDAPPWLGLFLVLVVWRRRLAA